MSWNPMLGYMFIPGYIMGSIWGLCMCMRMMTLRYDTKHIIHAFHHMQYPHPYRWLVVRRFVIPSLLAAPSALWMEGRDFFRRESAANLYGYAMHLRNTYGEPQLHEGISEEEEPGLPSVHVRGQRPPPPPPQANPDRPKYGSKPISRILNGE